MVAVQRWTYCGALVLWSLTILLFEIWQRDADGQVLFTAALLSLGIILLGALLRAWNWLARVKQPDPVATIAWSLSLWQILAWPCMIFSGAWLISEWLAAVILAAGFMVGLIFGAWSLRSHSQSPASAAEDCVNAGVGTRLGAHIRQPLVTLGWFTVGLIGAMCLTFLVAWGAMFLRGPIQGHNEWGTPVYANDQLLVNLGGGFTVLAIGWGAAVALRLLNAPRGLTWGIVAGMTLLGVLFAVGF